MNIDVSYNDLSKAQDSKIVPASLKKGIINAVYYESWTADVQIVGSVQTILKNVPISLALSASDVRVGDKCKIETFDESNPNDMVIAFTYGRARYKLFNSGSYDYSLGAGALVTFNIPHLLGDVPDIYGVSAPSFFAAGETKAIWISAAPDSTTLYFTGQGSQSGTLFWFVAKID